MSKKHFNDLIIYEIYPTSYLDSNHDGIGDLKGICSKLHYIEKLGFNALWLNPFYLSPFKDGGYDVEDFFSIDPRFGTMKDFKTLITQAHKRNIRVFIDLVAGHASMHNPDFLESAKSETNDKSDLFIWNDNPWEKGNNMISGMFDRHGCYMVNFFAHQPAFNYGFNVIDQPRWQISYKDRKALQAREYMLKVMDYWLGNGADGFRVDMADSLVKNDEDKSATIEVWKWMFARIRKKYPDAFFISEWSNPKQSFEAGFDADFVLDHWDNFYHRFFRSDPSSRGISILNGGNDVNFVLKDMMDRFKQAEDKKAYLSLISGNHDTWRIANYLSHEQLKIFYLFLFSMPGIPCVLYGDEIEMKTSDLPSKDGGYQRTGTRIPMIWDDSKPSHGFTDAEEPYLPFNPENTISVKQALKDKDSLYYYIQRLIQLRKTTKDLRDPKIEIKEKDRIFFFERGRYQLIMNLSEQEYAYQGEIIVSSADFTGKLPIQTAILVRKG